MRGAPRHCIQFGLTTVAKSLVDCPNLNAFRYFRVCAKRVGHIAARPLTDVAVGRHLIELVELIAVSIVYLCYSIAGCRSQ